jgi:uncharacterized protein Smg (DUF494 family)
MQEKIVEIIVYLMAELHANHQFSEQTFATLTDKGYTDTEISAAFGWIADKTALSERAALESNEHSFRILHSFERQYISADVYGYLLQLGQLGVMSHDQLESVIDRCVMSGMQPVDTRTVKLIIGALLVDGWSDSSGERFYLDGSETVH